MKVLILGIVLKNGGQENIAINLACGIAEYPNTKVIIATDLSKATDDKVAYISSRNVELYNLGNINKYNYIRLYNQIKKLYKKYNGIDVVHIHGVLRNGILAAMCKKIGVSKIISHCHSTNHGRKNNLLTLIYEKSMKKLIKLTATDYLACGYDAGEYLYGKRFFMENGIVLENSVDFGQYRFNSKKRRYFREKYNILDTDLVIGEVARLVSLKNPIKLLEIFKEILDIRKDCYLFFIGEGPETENINKLIFKYDLKNKVILLGNRNDVPDLLNMIDIIVLPSLYEGLPLSLVEAQCNGRMVFASNNITEEVKITNNLHFIDINEQNNVLAKMILNTKNIGIEKAEKQFLNSEYSLKKSVNKLYNIYLDIYKRGFL